MTNEDMIQKAYESYFMSKKPETIEVPHREKSPNIRDTTHESFLDTANFMRLAASSNMDTIDQVCAAIKPLLNAAWGSGWGEFSPDLKRGEKSNEIILPQITAEINERDVSEGMPKKPVLMDTYKETIDGKPAGDSILIYRQWFDCNVEFDFYGRTGSETRELLHKFETLLQVYAGYLKRHGISEMVFLKEFSARNSLNFMEQVPMKCIIFYMRFERIIPLRTSTINKINADIGIKGLNEKSLHAVIEHNKYNFVTAPDKIEEYDFDLDFGSGVDDSDI